MEIFSSDEEKANFIESCLFSGETENKVVRTLIKEAKDGVAEE